LVSDLTAVPRYIRNNIVVTIRTVRFNFKGCVSSSHCTNMLHVMIFLHIIHRLVFLVQAQFFSVRYNLILYM